MASYGAGRDAAYRARLVRDIEAFATAYQNDTSPNRQTVFLFPGGMGSQLVRSTFPNISFLASLPSVYYLSWVSLGVLWGEAIRLQIASNGDDYQHKYVLPDGGVDFSLPCFQLHPYSGFKTWGASGGRAIHVFVFGYDWRRGIQEAADFFLDVFLPDFESICASYPIDPLNKYSLIGHSLGGMVVKAIANQSGNAYVQNMHKAITVGGPFYGYGAQIRRYIMGDTQLNATIGGCLYRKLYPAVSMMKSAEDRSCNDLAAPMNGTADRRIFREGEMRSGAVVVACVGRKDPAQMGLAEDDDVIEAFPADRADQSLRMPVLPG